jgi:hypothetical protein
LGGKLNRAGINRGLVTRLLPRINDDTSIKYSTNKSFGVQSNKFQAMPEFSRNTINLDLASTITEYCFPTGADCWDLKHEVGHHFAWFLQQFGDAQSSSFYYDFAVETVSKIVTSSNRHEERKVLQATREFINSSKAFSQFLFSKRLFQTRTTTWTVEGAGIYWVLIKDIIHVTCTCKECTTIRKSIHTIEAMNIS